MRNIIANLAGRVLARLPDPIRLDREADAELAMGHVAAAERLAELAESLRTVGRNHDSRPLPR